IGGVIGAYQVRDIAGSALAKAGGIGTSGAILGGPREELVEGLFVAKARRRSPVAHELATLRPAGDVLVVGGVIPADVGDVLDIDPEQVEASGLWLPPEGRGHDSCVSLVYGRVGLGDRLPAHLVFAAGSISAGHDTVD